MRMFGMGTGAINCLLMCAPPTLPPTEILAGDGANFPTRQSNWECCQLLCISVAEGKI
jgi:hypothetical protein